MYLPRHKSHHAGHAQSLKVNAKRITTIKGYVEHGSNIKLCFHDEEYSQRELAK